ncbi:MAG: hypothetical protein U0670_02955 [Anaerolineae bacterium]
MNINSSIQALLDYWWLYGLICCAIPFIILLVVGFWVVRNAPHVIEPDMDDMRRSYDQLRAKHANLTTDQLVERIIGRQALRSGVIGAITSVGGLPELPLGLAVDLYTSARIQTTMLHFIAWAYQPAPGTITPTGSNKILDLSEALALQMGTSTDELLVVGGQQLSRYAARKLIEVVLEKSIAKVIPGLGLIIGFGVNYSITRGMGFIAARYYAARKGVTPPK